LALPEIPESSVEQQSVQPVWSSRFDLDERQYQRTLPRPERVWLHVLLFIITLISTSAVGARMQYNFDRGLPVFDMDRDLNAFWSWWPHASTLMAGLPFSLTLLLILLAHEFGHYIACLY